MIIRTYGYDYPVSSVMETNDTYNCYICRDLGNGGFCRIMSIKDKTLLPDLVSWLTATADPAVFTDYINSFNFEDTFCIVMKYTQGVSLGNKLSMESLTLSERLELGRRILERVVLQDIPDYFLDKCFDENNIIVAPDLTINFNYPIDDIIGNRECNPRIKVNRILNMLFAKELERNVPDVVVDFFKKLGNMPNYSMIELYSEYYMMQCRVEGDAGEGQEPKSIWYKLWERTKEILKIVKKVLMVVLMVVALLVLVLTIDGTKSSTKRNVNFDSIGTVEIDRNK